MHQKCCHWHHFCLQLFISGILHHMVHLQGPCKRYIGNHWTTVHLDGLLTYIWTIQFDAARPPIWTVE